MRITLFGAAGCVTGPAYYLQSKAANILVDFGIFQGIGTLGRKLVDGEKSDRIYGEEVTVNARIATLGGLSAHAGQSDLLQWFDAVAPSKPVLVLTHGEDSGRREPAAAIRSRYGIHAILPEYGDSVIL